MCYLELISFDVGDVYFFDMEYNCFDSREVNDYFIKSCFKLICRDVYVTLHAVS